MSLAVLSSPSLRRHVGLVLVAAAVTLTGCAASPTTTYRDANGLETTVQWRDYPADAYTDAGEVLTLPTVEEVADHWPEVREALAAAIEAELGDRAADLEWRAHGEEGWYPYGGNGYGGESMLQVYNSANWEAEIEVPPGAWQDILDAAERELAEWGIRAAPAIPRGEGDPDDSHWMDSVDLFQNGEFMTVTVQDARRDDDALADAQEHGWIVSGISLFYGIQTISDADRAEFERRAAPFRGLARPEPSHSD
jgi:hypothetical protein